MAAKLRKWSRLVLILLGIIIAVPSVLYLVLQVPAVQTRVVRKVTDILSENLQSEISIERVDYHFFNKIALSKVLFLDFNRDTLLYAEDLTAGIRKLGIKDKDFKLGQIYINNPLIRIIRNAEGEMNLKWYLDHLKKQDSTGAFNLTIDRIDLENAGFSLLDSAGNSSEIKKVDFTNLQLHSLNGTIEDFYTDGDTTSLNIYQLNFSDRSGFNIKRLDASLAISRNYIALQSAYINTDESILTLDKVELRTTGSAGYKNFINDVRLDVISENSMLSSSDLGYFVKIPDEIDEELIFSGRFTGTIAELRGRDIVIRYRENTILNCDFDISGLPEIANSFIYLGVNEFSTNVADIRNINIPGLEMDNLPDLLYRIGDMSFKGSFTGFTTDFVTYGEFITEIGSINTDISLRPDESSTYRLNGLISGINIDLGKLTDSEKLGLLTIHANVDGNASSTKNFSGNISGRIDSVEIIDYDYRNIELIGRFTDKTWDGNIVVADENIRMDLLGLFNFNDSLPEFDFTLNLAQADLYNLNIDKKDSTSALSLIMTSNFKGNSLDNLDGEINLVSSNLTKKGKSIELYDFTIRTFLENNIPALSLTTDFVDAEIHGNYNFRGLKMISSSLISSLVTSSPVTTRQVTGPLNNFTFNITLKNTNALNDFFETGFVIAENSIINGSVLPDTAILIEGSSEFIEFGNLRLDDIDFYLNTETSLLESGINTSTLHLPGNTYMRNLAISLNSIRDTFNLDIQWDNNEEILNKGKIRALGILDGSNRIPSLTLQIDSTEVYASNNQWRIDESSVDIDSGSLSINGINIHSRDKFYHVDGVISKNPYDTLHLAFRGIDISPLNHIRKRSSEEANDSNRIRMDLKGTLNGNISVTNVYINPLIESDIDIDNFSILGSEYGTVSLNSGFDYARKVVDIAVSNDHNGVNMFNANGFYDPVDKRVNIDILTNSLPVDALNPLLSSFASDISGNATGHLRLHGTTKNLYLNGSVMAERVNMRINYLQTLYTINDSIFFTNEGFMFNNMRFDDEEGSTASLSGIVKHQNFRNYTADLTINMAEDFKVLNTGLKDNSSFFGTVYASGVAKIITEPDLLSFDIAATTGRDTRFVIPLSDELSVSEYSFINFVDLSGNDEQKVLQNSEPPKQLGFDIRIDLAVTSDAVAEIIFDEKVGDKITGSGSGLLNINLNPKGDFRITGDYNIEKGDYLFTLGNILNKRFEVENGGTIIFNGDLDNAEIDLRAIYQKFNTSLGPILQDANRTERVSVEPQLVLSGRLFNPTVEFEINLPDSDEETKTYLRNAISSDEEVSRQFMYLLVMRSFYAEQSSTQYSSSPAGTTAMATTTVEMISNQFSNWISQINDNFNLGINYQPGSGNKSLNPDEVQLAFETQILDDRVIINGNFDYRSTTTGNSTDQLTGDFEAEVKLTEKVRLKVFNRFNDISSGKGPYTQGIGIFFKKDFQKLGDLFKRRNSEQAKKEDEVTLVDSTQIVNK